MSTITIETSRTIDGKPADVYAVIADYVDGHPHILPRPYFTDVTVTEGGIGAGTALVVHMSVYGAKATYHLRVREPEPGRVLVEEDPAAGVVTTFTVEPVNGNGQSRVTIATESRTSPGLKGLMERLLNPPITRKIYREELEQLAGVVKDRFAA